MRVVLVALALWFQPLAAQDAESLRAVIEEHYTAIHADDIDAITAHHLDDISIFPWNGRVLLEPGFDATASRMGANLPWVEGEVTMTHFSAQIYDDVGIALFYLDGVVGEEEGTWRVSAVWLWRDGEWKEAHHHESRLVS